MTEGISAASTATTYRLRRDECFRPTYESPTSTSSYAFHPLKRDLHIYPLRRKRNLALCVLTKNRTVQVVELKKGIDAELEKRRITSRRMEERLAKKTSKRETYLIAAVMSSIGITSMAIMAVYYKFSWQLEGGELPIMEMLGKFLLAVDKWREWYQNPRHGPFELTDFFAILNALPAIAPLAYGFFHKGLVPGLCFGAGWAITVFGMAYMFVHDGLMLQEIPAGPIADVPSLRRVAAAHQLHHSDKFIGIPYGLLLVPKELEEVRGLEELEKEIRRRIKRAQNSLLV